MGSIFGENRVMSADLRADDMDQRVSRDDGDSDNDIIDIKWVLFS